MTDAELQFCQFRSDELKHIHKSLQSVFEMSYQELTARYGKIKSVFNSCQMWPPYDNHFPRDRFKSQSVEFEGEYIASPSVAVDLPSFLETESTSEERKTIFIVGQDPKGHQDEKDISIGTPYGLHIPGCRKELHTTKLYFEMIKVLLDAGYRVYLTDVFKIWVCNPQNRYSRIKMPKVDEDRFLKVLQAEIEGMQPEAIITWGKEPSFAIQALGIQSHFSFPHPSGANNRLFKKLLAEKSPNHHNKLNYWKSFLRDEVKLSYFCKH